MDVKEIPEENIVVSVPWSWVNMDGIERQNLVTQTPIRRAWVVEICVIALNLIWRCLVPLRIITSTWKRIFILSCVAVSLDSLFLYVPIIDDKNKCLGMDKTLRNVALAFRSLTDIAFIFHIQLLITDSMHEGPKWDDSNSDSDDPATTTWLLKKLKLEAIAKKMPWLSIPIIVNFLAILPITQVSIVVAFFRMGGSKHLLKQTIINVCLVIQYFLRVSQILLSIKKVGETLGKWVKGSFYFLLYIIASQVLAAFGYFFSIQRETSCWEQACRTIPGCTAIYDCGHSAALHSTVLNKLCPVDSQNATLFDFGMYRDILQYANTGSTNFSAKFFYSFWWGLKNLSNFGTNLETSSYIWENCFAILISVIGLLLFLFLIGTVQTYIQSETEKFVKIGESRRMRINLKYKDIEKCMSSHGLRDDMKIDISKHINEDKVVEFIDKDVDTEFMLNCFYRHSIKSYPLNLVCANALKKIPILRNMDEEDSKVFCDYQYINYTTIEKDSYITRAGQTLYTMYLIIDGVIECKDAEKTGSSSMNTQTMRRHDYCGEEVLRWAILNYKQEHCDPLPSSTVNVKCQTKIGAFKFTADKLIKILKKLKNSEQLEVLALAHDRNTDDRIESTPTEEECRQEIFVKQFDILEWLVGNGFPEDLKANIMTCIGQNSLLRQENMDADVDVDFLFGILPRDIKPSIKCHLGMNALKKVPMLQKMHEYVLEIICNHLEPVVYMKNSYIVRAGEPLSIMIIIVQGTIILTDTTSSRATRSSSEITTTRSRDPRSSSEITTTCSRAPRSSSEITESCDDKILEKGGYYGEQLLSWASPNNISSSDNPVVSTRDVKCHTKVEALILKAADLRSAVSKCGSQWNFNNCMNSQQLVDDARDRVANTAPTSTIEQTIRLHQGQDIILEQLLLIRENIFRRLDDQGRRLDDMAAFLARVGYTGITGTNPAPCGFM